MTCVLPNWKDLESSRGKYRLTLLYVLAEQDACRGDYIFTESRGVGGTARVGHENIAGQ
jgi:hypothetical protein